MAFLNQSKCETTVGQCFSVAEIQAFLKATISVTRMVIFPFTCVLDIWFYENCMSQVGYAQHYARNSCSKSLLKPGVGYFFTTAIFIIF